MTSQSGMTRRKVVAESEEDPLTPGANQMKENSRRKNSTERGNKASSSSWPQVCPRQKLFMLRRRKKTKTFP